MQILSPARRAMGATLLMVAIAAVAAFALMSSRALEGADHTDAPGAMGDPAADITDVYAFRSPENPDNLVVVVNVNPLTAPAQNTSRNFASGVAYNIHVDNSGDLVADATATFTFSGSTFTVSGLGDPITGSVTQPSGSATANAPIIAEAGGIRAFAGQRDEPFFMDFVGFVNFVSGPFVPASGLRPAGETPSDTFAGTNVSSIVLELPIVALTGGADSSSGVIRAWASTSRGGTQVDRMAIPAINTALIPSEMKDAFNAGSPATDAAQFQAIGEATGVGLRTAVDAVLGAQDGGPLGDLTEAQVAGALIPDVVTIDFSQPLAFPNGRRLTDDVVDTAVGIVLNRGGGAGVPDAVGGNDRAFGSTFPYLAAPHQPAATVAAPAPPDSGNAGLAGEDGSGLGWQATSLLIAALGALTVVGGGYALRRRVAR